MTGFNVYALDNGLSSEKILGCLEQNDAHGPLRNRFATMQAMGCAASRHDSLPFVPGTNNGALTRIRHSLGAKADDHLAGLMRRLPPPTPHYVFQQHLKPAIFLKSCGTAKAVPFQNLVKFRTQPDASRVHISMVQAHILRQTQRYRVPRICNHFS
jgi:hypothetical protein